MDLFARLLVSLVTCGMFCVSICSAAPPNPEFAAAKQAFLRDIKKKMPSVRAAAVATLAEQLQTETVELLLKRAFVDDDASVQRAARVAMRKLADDRQVRVFLFDELKKSFRKHVVNEATVEVFRSLIVTDDESRQAEVLKILDEYLSSARSNPLVAMTVIDDLGVQGDGEAVRTVKLLSRVKAFDSLFGYRRCVVQAMVQIRQSEAIDFLIDLLPKSQGLIQYDIIQYLTGLTGQNFRDHDRNWLKWWGDNRSEFKFPVGNIVMPEIAADDQRPTYYGIPVCAKRVVFVLDTSSSMRGQPIDAAKQALLKVIQSLPAAVAFDVVLFDVQADIWQPRLIHATDEAKLEVGRIIIDRGLKGGTVSNEALVAAFNLEPEAIYFLSDGEPTDGAPSQIVSSISQLNRTRRVSINTIGVVTQRNGGIGLTLFMQPLAQKNYGTFRLVE